VHKDIEKVKEEQRRSQKDYDDVEKRVKKLKATLYGKFGNNINL
jgi:chaperonin cofactor prefoldin